MNEEEGLTLGAGNGTSGPVLGKSPEAGSRVGPEDWVFAEDVTLAAPGWRAPAEGVGVEESGSGLEAVRTGSGERCAICPGYNWEPRW